MTDFFSALELELHAAAGRSPRRRVSVGQALGGLAAAALLAIAVLLVLAVSGGGDGDTARVTGAPTPDPVGTVIPKGEGNPQHTARSLVVANGVAPVSGPWQIEVSRTKGERDTHGVVMWHKGYCLTITLLDPPGRNMVGGSGFCGGPRSLGFRKTPGFSRAQTVARSKPRPREILVWGRVPDRAAKVVITAPDRENIIVVPKDGPRTFPGRFYAIPVRPPRTGAQIIWLDANGRPGSRPIRLMPPITR